jgi:hypothetical protein
MATISDVSIINWNTAEALKGRSVAKVRAHIAIACWRAPGDAVGPTGHRA